MQGRDAPEKAGLGRTRRALQFLVVKIYIPKEQGKSISAQYHVVSTEFALTDAGTPRRCGFELHPWHPGGDLT